MQCVAAQMKLKQKTSKTFSLSTYVTYNDDSQGQPPGAGLYIDL